MKKASIIVSLKVRPSISTDTSPYAFARDRDRFIFGLLAINDRELFHRRTCIISEARNTKDKYRYDNFLVGSVSKQLIMRRQNMEIQQLMNILYPIQSLSTISFSIGVRTSILVQLIMTLRYLNIQRASTEEIQSYVLHKLFIS